MKVFVTGATGYVGFNVACAFRRAGHEVLGLCRLLGWWPRHRSFVAECPTFFASWKAAQ